MEDHEMNARTLELLSLATFGVALHVLLTQPFAPVSAEWGFFTTPFVVGLCAALQCANALTEAERRALKHSVMGLYGVAIFFGVAGAVVVMGHPALGAWIGLVPIWLICIAMVLADIVLLDATVSDLDKEIREVDVYLVFYVGIIFSFLMVSVPIREDVIGWPAYLVAIGSTAAAIGIRRAG